MPQRDPFGRLPGEDTLAGLGSPSDAIAAPSEAETVTPEPSDRDGGADSHAWREPAPARDDGQPATAGDRPRAGRSSATPVPKGSPRIVRGVVLALVVVLVLNIVVGLLADTATVSDQGSSEPAIATKAPDGPDPVGLQPRSMLVRANLAAALRRLRAGGLGQLRSLRIAPERVDAVLLTRVGKLRFVQVRSDGRLQRLSLSGGGFDGQPTIPFDEVDAAAPALLARSAAGRSKRPVSQVDYVVRLNAGSNAAWTVVMRGGGQFIGDARGTIIRRIS